MDNILEYQKLLQKSYSSAKRLFPVRTDFLLFSFIYYSIFVSEMCVDTTLYVNDYCSFVNSLHLVVCFYDCILNDSLNK